MLKDWAVAPYEWASREWAKLYIKSPLTDDQQTRLRRLGKVMDIIGSGASPGAVRAFLSRLNMLGEVDSFIRQATNEASRDLDRLERSRHYFYSD